jgi:hypothetical protein
VCPNQSPLSTPLLRPCHCHLRLNACALGGGPGSGLPSFNTCAAALNGLVSERPLTDEDNVEDYADRLADAICTVAAGSVSSESSHERGTIARHLGEFTAAALVDSRPCTRHLW